MTMGILLDMFEELRDVVKTVNEECGINDVKEISTNIIKDIKNEIRDVIETIKE